MNEQRLYDVKHHHFVGTVVDDVMKSRYGFSYRIEGWAVVDENDEVRGSFVDGALTNIYGEVMAIVRPNLG